MRARSGALGAFMAALAASPAALAHFQLLYTPQTALKTSQEITLAMVFTHPFEPTHTMNMEKPQALYVISQRGSDKILKDAIPMIKNAPPASAKARTTGGPSIP